MRKKFVCFGVLPFLGSVTVQCFKHFIIRSFDTMTIKGYLLNELHNAQQTEDVARFINTARLISICLPHFTLTPKLPGMMIAEFEKMRVIRDWMYNPYLIEIPIVVLQKYFSNISQEYLHQRVDELTMTLTAPIIDKKLKFVPGLACVPDENGIVKSDINGDVRFWDFYGDTITDQYMEELMKLIPEKFLTSDFIKALREEVDCQLAVSVSWPDAFFRSCFPQMLPLVESGLSRYAKIQMRKITGGGLNYNFTTLTFYLQDIFRKFKIPTLPCQDRNGYIDIEVPKLNDVSHHDWGYEVVSIAMKVSDLLKIHKNSGFHDRVFKTLIKENLKLQRLEEEQKIAARQQAWEQKRKAAFAKANQDGGAAKNAKK